MDGLAQLEDGSVHCVVTSPPYWGLRDYGQDGQIGLEPTPELYVEHIVGVFREVRRVLRDDGTLWLNLGDCYSTNPKGPNGDDKSTLSPSGVRVQRATHLNGRRALGLKPKDLVGIPWRVAFALQADGWWLRSDIIWSKPNPMPESVTDRPTRAHEYVFLLSKRARYYYDADAIREPHTDKLGTERFQGGNGVSRSDYKAKTQGWNGGGMVHRHREYNSAGRNKRSVWEIATQPFPGAHFATFPEALVKPCILAGSPEGGTVLDPFAGSGTVGVVAQKAGRKAVLIDVNPDYCDMMRDRLAQSVLL